MFSEDQDTFYYGPEARARPYHALDLGRMGCMAQLEFKLRCRFVCTFMGCMLLLRVLFFTAAANLTGVFQEHRSSQNQLERFLSHNAVGTLKIFFIDMQRDRNRTHLRAEELYFFNFSGNDQLT